MPPIAARVPASTSNLGAGFDCLGLALDIRLEARIVRGAGPARYTGTLEGLKEEDDLILAALGHTMPQDHHLEAHSEIPVSRGLGSSAAATVAGLALAQVLKGQQLDRRALFDQARQIEGHPDNVGPAVFGCLLLATAQPTCLQLHASLGIALAVPEQRVGTLHARSILPDRLTREDTIAQAAGAAALIVGLTSGDPSLIGQGMIDRIAVPLRRRLITGFDGAVEAGHAAGAYGVTISGSGSTLVGVCESGSTQTVARAMAEALTESGNAATPLAPGVSRAGVEV
ncbi:MAG: homoserine kinase [Gemmatimonadales bacterium]